MSKMKFFHFKRDNVTFRLLLPFLIFGIAILVLFTISRSGLVLWQWSRVEAAQMFTHIYLQGIRFDLVTLGLFLVIPATLTPLFCVNKYTLKYWKPVLLFYLCITIAAAVFIELATPAFINQFDTRPNIYAIEYLIFPKEVFMTLWAAYKIQLVVTVLAVFASIYISKKLLQKSIKMMPVIAIWQALILSPLILVSCALMARSTLDHRAVNPSTVAISTDPMVNSLCLNSLYTVAYAVYGLSKEPGEDFRYASMPDDEVIRIIRKDMEVAPNSFTSDKFPTYHFQRATKKRENPINIIIILEESLGAEFVGSLGGLPLTPNLDKLSQQGMWFENMYATGIRSVRGIEAVVTGFPPTPAMSVVKLEKSQSDFFTLAKLLSKRGYHNSFIYGGEAQFDNMRRFFMNNGFDYVIDEKDYDNPVFIGSWGVSDEDLFNRAHKYFTSLGNQPFFSLVFTSSNHTPFQFPDGRIELYDTNKNTVNNAVKYADYTLGQFIDNARQSEYWRNTIFLIVADHNSRVHGADLIPIEHFHIPALILGGAIKPGVFSPVASQLDLPPTLLSLIGISSEHPMIGHDLTRPVFLRKPGRAIMQYGPTQGYMKDNKVVIMQKELPIKIFSYKANKLTFKQTDDTDKELLNSAIAESIFPLLAYQSQLYQ